MSRKPPTDTFTRFTSTTPTASTNTNFTAKPSLSPPSSSNQPTETPAQKVARLRAAHQAKQSNTQLSPVDRLISRGRSFADTAHRLTTYSLLAITGVSTVIAAYGLVSLVSHNRRQKRAWIEREFDRLREAQQAFLRGEATAEQLHLLEQERAGEEIAKKFQEDKARRKEEGAWSKLKGTFGTFTSRGDMGVESKRAESDGPVGSLSELVDVAGPDRSQLLNEGWVGEDVRPAAVQASSVQGVGFDDKGRPVPLTKMQRSGDSRRSHRGLEPGTARKGGPLDMWADNAADRVQSTGQGWWSWISGSSSGSSKPTTS